MSGEKEHSGRIGYLKRDGLSLIVKAGTKKVLKTIKALFSGLAEIIDLVRLLIAY